MAEVTITKQDAAHQLGVSDATVGRMCRDGRLQGYRVAGRLRVVQQSVDELIEGCGGKKWVPDV